MHFKQSHEINDLGLVYESGGVKSLNTQSVQRVLHVGQNSILPLPAFATSEQKSFFVLKKDYLGKKTLFCLEIMFAEYQQQSMMGIVFYKKGNYKY